MLHARTSAPLAQVAHRLPHCVWYLIACRSFCGLLSRLSLKYLHFALEHNPAVCCQLLSALPQATCYCRTLWTGGMSNTWESQRPHRTRSEGKCLGYTVLPVQRRTDSKDDQIVSLLGKFLREQGLRLHANLSELRRMCWKREYFNRTKPLNAKRPEWLSARVAILEACFMLVIY